MTEKDFWSWRSGKDLWAEHGEFPSDMAAIRSAEQTLKDGDDFQVGKVLRSADGILTITEKMGHIVGSDVVE